MVVSLLPKRHLVRAVILFGLLSVRGLHAEVPATEYESVIRAAHNGQPATALEKLRDWHRADPRNSRILFDLAAVSDMAGHYAGGMEYFNPILALDAPPYALKAIAHCARMTGRPADAARAYEKLITKTPQDMEAHAGLAYAWMAQDRTAAAYAYLMAQLPAWPRRAERDAIPILVALAELHEQRREWIEAAGRYQEALQLDPGFRFVLRGRAFALNAAGLPHQAMRLAALQADAFTTDEMHQFDHNAAAGTIGFGEAQLAADSGAGRFASTDVALAENSAILQQFGPMSSTRFDRLVALKNRLRMREVVELYQTLQAENVSLPVYAKFTVADAYLFLQQPEAARDLYLEGFREAGTAQAADALNWKISLLYAHLEAEQHDAATALADRLVQETPRWINKGIPGLEGPHPDYARVQLLRILLDMYGDRLALAEQRLAAARTAAPHNSDIRSAWASLQSAREHPRMALEEFTLLQVDEPKSVSHAIGRGESLLALNRFTEAKAVLPALQAEQPDNRNVQKFENRLAIHAMPLFRADTTIGRGQSAAGAESVFDASLYSSPLSGSFGDPYRVFGHVAHAQGHAGGQQLARTRAGMGVDYREQDLAAEAELHRMADADRGNDRTGVALALAYDLSDYWHGRVSADTNVIDLPAAAIRNGVHAEALKLGLTWQMDESRKAGADIARLRFSDGNVRDTVRGWWMERWISAPDFKLETVLSASASNNSLGGRDYFNPARDHELNLDLKAEWLAWRRYQRSFKQRLALSLGRYWQAGYSPGPAADLRYEHEWSWDDMAGLRYGIGHAFHPYDGKRDSRNYGFLGIYGRFK